MFGAGMRTTLAQRLVYPLFNRCLIKHVLTVWPLTSTSNMFGHQTCLIDGEVCFHNGGRQHVFVVRLIFPAVVKEWEIRKTKEKKGK